MGLFQNSILRKYLKGIDDKVSAAYKLYAAYFHNTDIQENIRNCKEEQFQEGFLRELFVKILGYTLYPEPNHNLITELKNEQGTKKADAAILVNGEAIGVIELKDGKTTDLKQVEAQAFGYKNYHRNASYVVISNFEKLRFYIDNAIDFIEFNLFTLNQDDFAILWLCLDYSNIERNLPKQMKSESTQSEDLITKQLYKEYAIFKHALFADLTARNPSYDKLTLFKKSQKLLDRLLFILFAEDCGLLPPNSIAKIITQWEELKELDEYKPLYDRFKKYFGYMNTGFKGKNHDVFAYNGGLFAIDDVLDSVNISDEALVSHLQTISRYDFSSEVDVNILGHIFENSLTEIEEVAKAISANVELQTISKRKKDGVFYTPRYITIYIVENTLGKLCADKKTSLGINETEYISDKKRSNTIKRNLEQKLLDYRKWLLSLTICDPACGSGAFLNAALDFLIAEHRLIDEMRAKIYDGVYQMFDNIENDILEKNLYGVDINEESVEIAKLALWLRTAKPHRKLNSLNDNIKCGNSLISDSNVAGDKAFDWEKEFPQVFENGGFDVVIGNPPWGAKIDKTHITYLSEKYTRWGISSALNDTYFVFYAFSLDRILKVGGYLGFISPNTWKLIDNAKLFRKVLLDEFEIYQMIQHLNKVFEDATVDCDTLIIKKSNIKADVHIRFLNELFVNNEHFVSQKKLAEQDYINLFLTPKDYDLRAKITAQSALVNNVLVIKNGVKPYEKGKGKPAQTDITMKEKPFTSEIKKDDSFSPLIGGSYFHKYKLLWNNDYWIQYGEWLAAPRDKGIFDAKEKLIFRQTSDSIIGTFIGSGFIIRNNTHILLNKENSTLDLKYALTLLNSKLVNWYYWTINPEKGEAMAEVKAFHLGLLPIKEISSSEQQPFIALAESMLSLNSELQTKRQRFLKRLSDNFISITITGAIDLFYELDFKQFVAELKKQKIVLSLKQQDKWEEYFAEYKKECCEIVTRINVMDNEIDKLVYGLYGLTDAEISIIEGGLK